MTSQPRCVYNFGHQSRLSVHCHCAKDAFKCGIYCSHRSDSIILKGFTEFLTHWGVRMLIPCTNNVQTDERMSQELVSQQLVRHIMTALGASSRGAGARSLFCRPGACEVGCSQEHSRYFAVLLRCNGGEFLNIPVFQCHAARCVFYMCRICAWQLLGSRVATCLMGKPADLFSAPPF
jgi:hypothetical protein